MRDLEDTSPTRGGEPLDGCGPFLRGADNLDLRDQLKILILGGVAVSLVNFRGTLIKRLVAQGHDVIASAGDANDAISRAIEDMGARFLPMEIERAGLNPLGDIKFYWELRKTIRSLRIDGILSYTIKPAIYGSLAAAAEGVPRILSLITGLGYAFGVGGPKARLVGMIARRLYKLALRGTSEVIFQNRDNAELFLELGLVAPSARWSIVDGSGVDTDHFAVANLPDAPSFLMIARLLRDKGTFEYVSGSEFVKRAMPQAQARLLGDLDPNPSSVSRTTLDSWMASGSIEYLEGRKDVRPAISECAVYVLPSYSEGLPRTVLEAMSMGRAIITTLAPGCRETVNDPRPAEDEDLKGILIGTNGLLVPVKDAEALGRAMLYLARRPQLVADMGRSSRGIAVAKFDSKIIDEKMVKIITGSHENSLASQEVR